MEVTKKSKKKQEKISSNISYKEATFSQTANRLKIKNVPTEAHLKNMRLVAEKVFQPLREWCEHPIRINSMYRCAELCEAIGSSASSQHTKGQAIDMTSLGDKSNRELFEWIKENLDFDQMIWELGGDPAKEGTSPRWIHISYVNKKANRNRILRAKAKGSQITYYVM
jgi:zinc D-Ala-D-Ala carboxypeptidase